MSPEQVRGKDLDARTDLFSFGVVLYEMVTGALPYRGETSGVIFEAILNRAPVPPVRLNPGLPPKFEDVINRGLEKDRELRYQHASEMKSELMRLKRDTDSGRAALASDTDHGRTEPALSDRPQEGSRVGILDHPAAPSSARVASVQGASRTKPALSLPKGVSAPHETAGYSGRSKRVGLWAGAAVAVLLLAGISFYFVHARGANALTEKDSILLADFVNTTGDSVFDGTLKQALAVQLEQSPYFNLTPESRIQEGLKFMGRSPDERLTNDVAHEICLREGIKAMLTGSIASLGSHYVIDLNAINAQNGDSIAREQAEAESKEAVLRTLDSAASKLRSKLGESVASIQKFATPLEQATTSSLEALQAFSLGQEQHEKLADERAIAPLKHAIELDPNFAMAYATLGVVYSNLAQTSLSDQAMQKAFELKDRASEHERLYITAHYYSELQRDIDKTISTYQSWINTYPRETVALDNLSLQYVAIGQDEKALASSSEAMRVDPKDRFAYQNVAEAYMHLNRFDETKAILDKADAQGMYLFVAPFARYIIGFTQHDVAAMQRAPASSQDDFSKALVMLFQVQAEYYQGKISSGRKATAQLVDFSKKAGMTEFAASMFLLGPSFEAEMGDFSGVRPAINAALAMAKDRDTRTEAAVVMARTGDSSGAEKMIADLAKQYPNDTMLNSGWIPMARATAETRRNSPMKAIELLESTRPYELGSGPLSLGYWPNYIRAEAYLKTHDGAKAATEYKTILDHQGVDPVNPLYALAHLGLGRAYALQGDSAKARTAYQDFLATWKDADSDVPVLKQAKAEYAKLQ
jgi:tetratricopeptide (TPR) repeat protein